MTTANAIAARWLLAACALLSACDAGEPVSALVQPERQVGYEEDGVVPLCDIYALDEDFAPDFDYTVYTEYLDDLPLENQKQCSPTWHNAFPYSYCNQLYGPNRAAVLDALPTPTLPAEGGCDGELPGEPVDLPPEDDRSYIVDEVIACFDTAPYSGRYIGFAFGRFAGVLTHHPVILDGALGAKPGGMPPTKNPKYKPQAIDLTPLPITPDSKRVRVAGTIDGYKTIQTRMMAAAAIDFDRVAPLAGGNRVVRMTAGPSVEEFVSIRKAPGHDDLAGQLFWLRDPEELAIARRLEADGYDSPIMKALRELGATVEVKNNGKDVTLEYPTDKGHVRMELRKGGVNNEVNAIKRQQALDLYDRLAGTMADEIVKSAKLMGDGPGEVIVEVLWITDSDQSTFARVVWPKLDAAIKGDPKVKAKLKVLFFDADGKVKKKLVREGEYVRHTQEHGLPEPPDGKTRLIEKFGVAKNHKGLRYAEYAGDGAITKNPDRKVLRTGEDGAGDTFEELHAMMKRANEAKPKELVLWVFLEDGSIIFGPEKKPPDDLGHPSLALDAKVRCAGELRDITLKADSIEIATINADSGRYSKDGLVRKEHIQNVMDAVNQFAVDKLGGKLKILAVDGAGTVNPKPRTVPARLWGSIPGAQPPPWLSAGGRASAAWLAD